MFRFENLHRLRVRTKYGFCPAVVNCHMHGIEHLSDESEFNKNSGDLLHNCVGWVKGTPVAQSFPAGPPSRANPRVAVNFPPEDGTSSIWIIPVSAICVAHTLLSSIRILCEI